MTWKKKFLIFFVLSLSFMAHFCGKADVKDITQLPFMKIAKPETGALKADIISIELDSEVYDKTNNIYSDIRLVDEKGSEMPFAVKQLQARKLVISKKKCDSKVIFLRNIKTIRLK